MTTPLVFDRVNCTRVLRKVADLNHRGANQLYVRLMGTWGHKPDRERVTFNATDTDLEVLRAASISYRRYEMNVVHSGWQATYRDPKNSKLEVVVTSEDKPPKRRTFKSKGGKRRLVRVAAKRISSTKEAVVVATKTKKRKAVEEDELDELDALEELEDLDEDEDEELEDEEPEDEEEDEEEEEPAPKKRSKSKKTAAKKPARKRKAAEDEDDEDDDEDEDDEPAPRKKGKARQSSAKTKSKSSGSKKKKAAPQTRELPAGKYGPQDIADDAGCDARYVRVFLRAHPDEFPKDEESFRYAFNKRDFQRVVKAIKKQRASED